jgi:hypothetical protein
MHKENGPYELESPVVAMTLPPAKARAVPHGAAAVKGALNEVSNGPRLRPLRFSVQASANSQVL